MTDSEEDINERVEKAVEEVRADREAGEPGNIR